MQSVIEMKYESLKAIFYQHPNDFDEYYQKRFNNLLAVKTGLDIYPYDKKRQKRINQKYEIFYLPNNELSILIEKVFQNTQKIEEIRLKLPQIAEEQLFATNLVNELQSTNEIEGVKSTRKELNEVMKRVIKKDYKDQRFEGLVEQYLQLMKKKQIKIERLKDFRHIWDNLLSKAEVEDVPDGKLFRKDSVFISDGQRNVHEGDYNEEQISHDLTALIKELNNDQIPQLPRYLMAHYFYEYVHPFYDGNGRTGRYILCSYLAQVLDPLTAITFSSTIAKRKNSYYKAFTEMSDVHNRAEATNFIIRMLKILYNGQLDLIDAMRNDSKALEKAKQIIAAYPLTDNAREVLYILLQQAIFGNQYDQLSDAELSKIIDISRYKLTQVIEELEAQRLIKQVGKSPKSHVLNDKLRS